MRVKEVRAHDEIFLKLKSVGGAHAARHEEHLLNPGELQSKK